MDSEVPEMWHCLCPWVFPVWGGTGSKYASFLVLVDGKQIEVEVPLALAKTVHLHACKQQELLSEKTRSKILATTPQT